MTLIRKRILSVLLVAIIGLMCFGMMGCSEDGANALTLTGADSLSINLDGDLETLLTGVTLVFTDPYTEDGNDSMSFEGLNQMKEAGVSVIWSGSTQEVKNKGKGLVSFSYNGYVVTCEYTIN